MDTQKRTQRHNNKDPDNNTKIQTKNNTHKITDKNTKTDTEDKDTRRYVKMNSKKKNQQPLGTQQKTFLASIAILTAVSGAALLNNSQHQWHNHKHTIRVLSIQSPSKTRKYRYTHSQCVMTRTNSYTIRQYTSYHQRHIALTQTHFHCVFQWQLQPGSGYFLSSRNYIWWAQGLLLSHLRRRRFKKKKARCCPPWLLR